MLSQSKKAQSSMKMLLKSVFLISVSFIGFVSAFYSTGLLMVFLSHPIYLYKHVNSDAVWSLLVDMVLLAFFAAQHTLMALPAVKKFLADCKIGVLSRSLYILGTSTALTVLVKYWQITDVTIWNIDLSNKIVWYMFNLSHLFAWSVVYTGSLFMDLTEILGVKQVYYHLRKMPDPMAFKSAELQRLYGHTRHPSFCAFSFIFWFSPIMSLDRLLLVIILTSYMMIAWRTDRRDLFYQQSQYTRKSQELTCMN